MEEPRPPSRGRPGDAEPTAQVPRSPRKPPSAAAIFFGLLAGPRQPGAPRRKVSRARAIVLLSGMAALVVVIYLGLEALFSPWARSLIGGPTLTGEWVGEMTTASGRRLQMWLLVEHRMPTGKCANCPRIEGKVRTCEVAGEKREYRLSGNVENWRGTAFRLQTLDEQEHARKLTLGTLNGRWSGDTLELTTELRVPGESTTIRWERDAAGQETTRIIGGDPDTHDPVEWRMERGSEREFRRWCR
jgi:hypothetical protein